MEEGITEANHHYRLHYASLSINFFYIDRFTSLKDVRWFEEILVSLAQEELGLHATKGITKKNYFVDFLR